jgi:hypothetical protein
VKFEPVRWMTLVLAVLSALAGTAALTDLLPVRVVGAVGVAIAVLTAVLGVLTRGAVTPLAQPRDAVGTPLVPNRMGRT